MRSRFLASVAVIEFYAVEAYSSLGRTSVKYNISSISRVERNRLEFVLNPASLQIGRKCSLHVRGNAVLNQVVPQGLV
jgi:hypothetical protein